MTAPFNDRGPFSVGEVCRLVNIEKTPELNGHEVTIALIYPFGAGYEDSEGKQCFHDGVAVLYGYYIDGIGYVSDESQLRRKRPPSTGEDKVMELFTKTPNKLLEPA